MDDCSQHAFFCLSCHSCVLSCIWLFAALWTVIRQAPLSMGFSRQEYWSWFPFHSPGDLPNPGSEPASPLSPALQADYLLTGPSWKPWPLHKSCWMGRPHDSPLLLTQGQQLMINMFSNLYKEIKKWLLPHRMLWGWWKGYISWLWGQSHWVTHFKQVHY